jgi:iron complex outermembrane receptor protein
MTCRAVVKVTDRTSLLAGLRYNRDELRWRQTQTFDPESGQYQGCTTAPANFGPPTCNWSLADTSSATVGDLGLQRRFGSDSIAFFTFARGYKPKVYNTDHAFVSKQDAPDASDLLVSKPTDQEKINHVEIGLKSVLRERKLTLNLSAFNTVYIGYQVETVDLSKAPVVLIKLGNGRALTRGMELQLDWVPNGRAHLSTEFAYIDALITSFPAASCYPTQTEAEGCIGGLQDLSGHVLPDSPKFKFNVNIERRVALGRNDLVLGGNVAYRSAALFQANGNPRTRQAAFALLNLSAGLVSADGKVSATLFVNNVTNRFYLTDAEDFFSAVVGLSPEAGGNFVVGQPARDSHRFVGARLTIGL